MRWIYISPHFDDAVLSCGGLIWEQARSGIQVEIWTICAGTPSHGPVSDFAQQLHAEWGGDSARQMVEIRQREDYTAARIVGAQAVHFPFLDCIYRLSDQNEPYYTEDVFIAPNLSDSESLPREIYFELQNKLDRSDILVCPLAVGAHVDHQLVRMAVERLINRTLYYYADLPYALRQVDQNVEKTREMEVDLFPISPEGLIAWQEGVLAYTSQLHGLFEDESDMRDSIRDYWQDVFGIRLWKQKKH